eukprot:scaffold3162_cov58-Phaeocystis_antarctica.AAC.1
MTCYSCTLTGGSSRYTLAPTPAPLAPTPVPLAPTPVPAVPSPTAMPARAQPPRPVSPPPAAAAAAAAAAAPTPPLDATAVDETMDDEVELEINACTAPSGFQ